MTDRHDAEVFAHQQRQDRAETRYHKLRYEATNNVAERFRGDLDYFREQMYEYAPDILHDLIYRDAEHFRTDDPMVALSLLKSLVNGVYTAMEQHEVEQETERLNN